MEATYRIIEGEKEWYLVRDFYQRMGLRQDIIPSHQFAKCAVVELDNKIIAAWFIQIVVHYEPIVIDKEYTKHVFLRSLLSKVEEAQYHSMFRQLPYFCFIDTEHAAAIGKALGLEKLEGVTVWSKIGSYLQTKDAKVEAA
jgi:hypothetical protein